MKNGTKELNDLILVIKDIYKYNFSDYAMTSFKRRVDRFMQLNKYASVSKLQNDIATNHSLFEKFLDELTVNTTEMFRDPSFWKVLKESVIPELFSKKAKFKIWHAGCSSGEEVYSMTILLKEMGLLDRATIVASDLDKIVLEKAQEGKYMMRNMLLNENNYQEFLGKRNLFDYCNSQNGKVTMDPSLLKNTTFKIHDLVNDDIFESFDLILCRNVMIYFNQSLQNFVLNKFHQTLVDHGYFASGSKESMTWSFVLSKFNLVNKKENIYQKIKD